MCSAYQNSIQQGISPAGTSFANYILNNPMVCHCVYYQTKPNLLKAEGQWSLTLLKGCSLAKRLCCVRKLNEVRKFSLQTMRSNSNSDFSKFQKCNIRQSTFIIHFQLPLSRLENYWSCGITRQNLFVLCPHIVQVQLMFASLQVH